MFKTNRTQKHSLFSVYKKIKVGEILLLSLLTLWYAINKMLLNTVTNLVSIFVNRFTLSLVALNNVIYLFLIAFSIVFCCLYYCAILPLTF